MTIEEKLAVAKGGIIHACGGYVFGKSFLISTEGGRKNFEIRTYAGKFGGTFPLAAIYQASLDKDNYLVLFLH